MSPTDQDLRSTAQRDISLSRSFLLARSQLVIWLGLALSIPTLASADCVFVNRGAIENGVSAFRVGPARMLEEVSGSPFPSYGRGGFGPATGSLAKLGNFLYVVNSGEGSRTIGSVAGFVVQPDCSLTEIPGSPWQAGFESSGIAIEPRYRRLYVSSFREDSIFRYSVESDGTLTYEGVEFVGLLEHPYDLLISPNGRFLFATHHQTASFVAYRISREDGTLTESARYHPPAMFLDGLTVSSNGRFLYAVDQRNSNIHGVVFLPSGSFRPIPGSPWKVPPVSTIADSHLTPDGNFLFVTNTTSDEISVFGTSGRGELTELSGSPFPSATDGAWGLETSPDGEILIEVNAGRGGISAPCGSNCVAAYLIENGVPIPDPAGPSSLGSGNAGSALYYVFEKTPGPG